MLEGHWLPYFTRLSNIFLEFSENLGIINVTDGKELQGGEVI
jgi:hypothetical protein